MDFLQANSLYVVALIAVLIWLGLFMFMLGVNRRLTRLEAGRSKPATADRVQSTN